MSRTIEDLIIIAYPLGNAPAFEHTPECRATFSHLARLARREHERTLNHLTRLRLALNQREVEAANAIVTTDELITLPTAELAQRWNTAPALFQVVAQLSDEIENAEASLAALESQFTAAEELACLAAMPEGSTPEDLAAHRERQIVELEERERVECERLEAERAAEIERVDALSIEEIMRQLFTNPPPYLAAALIYGQNGAAFNRSNFAESETFLRERFSQHQTPARLRMYQRLWERLEEVSTGKVHKQYPTPRLPLASALGAR